MPDESRQALLAVLYRRYLEEQDSSAFSARVKARYTLGTLERLAASGARDERRGAVFALGLLADYRSNAVLGRALHDEDPGVRSLAESAIRVLWCRAGSERERHDLATVIRLNAAHRYADAVRRATRLIDQTPWIAEAWNQRAIAQFSLGQYERSIDDCRSALEANPYHFGAASGMGQCHVRLGNRVAALECFRRALAINPSLDSVRAQVEYLERMLQE